MRATSYCARTESECSSPWARPLSTVPLTCHADIVLPLQNVESKISELPVFQDEWNAQLAPAPTEVEYKTMDPAV